MQTGAPSVWEYTKGRPSRRRRVPGNSTHAGRAHFPRPRGVVGSPASGARKTPRVSSRRNPRPALSSRRGPGKREAGSGGASAVGTCSPLASQERVPARRKPTSCRCQNYTSRHPLRGRAESENKFWAARELPSAGSPHPLPAPPVPSCEAWRRKAAFFSFGFLGLLVPGVRGTQALSHRSRPRAREGRGFLASPQSGRGNLWGRRPRPGSGARQPGRRGVTSRSRVFFSISPGCAVSRKAAARAQPCIRQGSPMRSERADRCLGPPPPAEP